jgi:hypothetical protein
LLYYPQKTTAPTDHKPQPSAPAIPPKSGTQQRLEKPLLRMYFTKPYFFLNLHSHEKPFFYLNRKFFFGEELSTSFTPPQWC